MSSLDTPGVARRGFLKRLSASVAGVAAVSVVPAQVRSHVSSSPLYWTDPDAWIDRMRGVDRLVFHAHLHLAPALGAARGVLTNARDSYDVDESDNAVAVATHGPAIGGVFRDEIWERFRLGQVYGVIDENTAQGVIQNPYLRAMPDMPADATVPALMQRGVQFIACNVAMRKLARRLAGPTGDAEATHLALLGGVVPGTIVVPDVYVALSHAQQRGVSYVYIG